jgi:hypothetical protein
VVYSGLGFAPGDPLTSSRRTAAHGDPVAVVPTVLPSAQGVDASMAGLASTNVIDLTPHLAKRALTRSAHHAVPNRNEMSAVIPLPLGRGSLHLLPPLPPAA